MPGSVKFIITCQSGQSEEFFNSSFAGTVITERFRSLKTICFNKEMSILFKDPEISCQRSSTQFDKALYPAGFIFLQGRLVLIGRKRNSGIPGLAWWPSSLVLYISRDFCSKWAMLQTAATPNNARLPCSIVEYELPWRLGPEQVQQMCGGAWCHPVQYLTWQTFLAWHHRTWYNVV